MSNYQSDIKYFAEVFVKELDTVPNPSKKMFLKFIEGASALQIEHFLCTGRMIEENQLLSEVGVDAVAFWKNAYTKAVANMKAKAALGKTTPGQEAAFQKAKAAAAAAKAKLDAARSVGTKIGKGVDTAVTATKAAAGKAVVAGKDALTATKAAATAHPGIAAGIAAAAVIAAGALVYKRMFSKAAKSCSGKSGSEKTKCMAQFKVNAKRQQMSTLAKGIAKCKDEKCKAKLKGKIQSLKSQMGS